MQVRVLYLGMLKDIAGRERELVQLSDGARLGDLYRNLQERIPARCRDWRALRSKPCKRIG